MRTHQELIADFERITDQHSDYLLLVGQNEMSVAEAHVKTTGALTSLCTELLATNERLNAECERLEERDVERYEAELVG